MLPQGPRGQQCPSSYLMFHHFTKCAEIRGTLDTVTSFTFKDCKMNMGFPGFSTVYLPKKCQRQLPSQSGDSWE